MDKKNPNIQGKAYLALYEAIRNEIREGRYQREEKIPSKRQLADDFGVSVITVEHALDLLVDEGYILSKERSGYFVAYAEDFSFEDIHSNEMKAVLQEFENPAPVHRQSASSFSAFRKSMRSVFNIYDEALFAKSPNAGCLCLREAIANYLFQNRKMEVSPEQIIIGAGAEYLYGLLVLLFGKKQRYGIEYPSYEKIEQVYRANGVEVLQLPLGPHGIVSEALHREDFQILHVSPYRSFPSGVSADASKRMEYIRWVNEKENRFIIEDDFESEFYPESKPAETIYSVSKVALLKEKVVYLNTFTKTISASIRVGYLVLPKTLVKHFEENVGFLSCTVPTFEQYVLADYLNSGNFTKNINRIRRQRRNINKKN